MEKKITKQRIKMKAANKILVKSENLGIQKFNKFRALFHKPLITVKNGANRD